MFGRALAARREVLRALGRNRLGVCQRVVVERSLARKLNEWRLDLKFVLRDLVGRELLTVDGANLALTAAGRAAAAEPRTAKRKR